MTAWSIPFYSNGALLVMWGALIMHLLLPLPRASHPMALWRKFAELLAAKVNGRHSYSQSMLSGTLALLLMLLPALAVLWAMKPLVWQPQLFDLALLLLALDWRNTETFGQRFTVALAHDDKPGARRILAPWVNRSTDTLSPLGLGKAGTETLVVGYGRNLIAVLFWYGLLGGIGALCYRLILELARGWSPSRQQYSPFGLPAVRLLAWLDVIPLRLLAAMVATGQRGREVWQLIKQQTPSWPLPGPAWLLVAVGAKLQLTLGGPAIYQQQKAVRAKIGGRIAPSALHLAQVRKLLFGRAMLWIFLQSLVMGVLYHGV
ncbi:cobalamin biosynthesis family protein [Vibrio sp.]|uniref:cobalamin biosynthesis family protein n=1 Tax=Vibrio sp. TaxID=678 RepID=UPI003D0E94D7